MTTTPRHADPLDRVLAGLPSRAPDPSRATRTRVRCHAALSRPDWRERFDRSAGLVLRRIEPAAATAAALVFLGEVIHRALRLYGLLGD